MFGGREGSIFEQLSQRLEKFHSHVRLQAHTLSRDLVYLFRLL